jgi:hypothetical protein
VTSVRSKSLDEFAVDVHPRRLQNLNHPYSAQHHSVIVQFRAATISGGTVSMIAPPMAKPDPHLHAVMLLKYLPLVLITLV